MVKFLDLLISIGIRNSFIYIGLLLLFSPNVYAQDSVPLGKLFFKNEMLLQANGFHLKKVVDNHIYLLGYIAEDSCYVSKYDNVSYQLIEKKFKINPSGEIAKATDFTVMNDSLLVILTMSRNGLAVYNLKDNLKKLLDVDLSNDSVPLYNGLKSVGKELYLIFRAREYNEVKSHQITFSLCRIDLFPKIQILNIVNLYDDNCLLYGMNSFVHTWAVNDEYLFYSNGCSGEIQVYSLKDGQKIAGLELFEDTMVSQTIKSVESIGLKYRLRPSQKLLQDLDHYLFNRPNIYLLDCVENKLLVVYNSVRSSRKSFVLEKDMESFMSNLTYNIYSFSTVDSTLQFNDLSYNIDFDELKSERYWNYNNLTLVKKSVIGSKFVCDSHEQFNQNRCNIRIKIYHYLN